MIDTADMCAQQHRLQCMEIWGGTGAAYDAVSAPGLDVWMYSRPYGGSARGGDIHYLSGCAAGHITRVAVADVSGHGESVSDTAKSLRTLMRKNINTADQAKLAKAINTAFTSETDGGLFATAILGTYLAPERSFQFVNAGHPRPLLSRAGGPWTALHPAHDDITNGAAEQGLSNLPLGVLPETAYEQMAVQLGVDDRLLLYTDLAVEARTPDGKDLCEEGLIRLLNELDVADGDLIPALVERIETHTGSTDLEDDLTVVLLRHNAAPAPPQCFSERMRTLGRVMGVLPV